MKSRKARIFFKVVILTFMVICIGVLSLFVYFFAETKDVKLNVEALEKTSEETAIQIEFHDGEKLDLSKYFTSQGVKIDELKPYTIGAFVSTEDKRFYTHHGVDYKRVVGALFNNIKSGKFSQGASTISQQLIKNTHLSREKTIKRKIKEMKLAMELEKKYSKDEILEMYLSTIYFGNGCYGIENASHFYFDKKANELTIGQSALLAATINAPTYYDIISKNERAEKRKKLVLKNMLKSGYISQEEYEKSANKQENIVKNASKQQNSLIKSVLSEASKILNIAEKNLKNEPLTIKLYADYEIENKLQSALEMFDLSDNYGAIIIDNNSKGVVAISSNIRGNILNSYRQPGSTIKPIIVYAPALERGLLYPESIIVDEPIDIGGYAPQNANKTFLGNVSVRTAVEKSLNVPAVKTLSNLGVENAKDFASNLGIVFDERDSNLALALGGMTKGVTIKQLADAYSAIASSGYYSPSNLIESISSNGKTIYKSEKKQIKAMSDSTAYLMSDILKGVVNNGTAKRLKSLNQPICAKTGTVGKSGSKDNCDAYCVAYTPLHTIVVWIGASSKALDGSINGSNYPTEIVKKVFSSIYESPLQDFKIPIDVAYLDIDTRSLEENKVELADSNVEARFKKEALFSLEHLPEFSTPKVEVPTIVVRQIDKPRIEFETANNHYKLIRQTDNLTETICEFEGDGLKFEYDDLGTKSGEIYEYYIEISPQSDGNCVFESNHVKIMSL